MRSYVLSGDMAHYDAVIKRFAEHNIQVIPAFSGGLDARPAIEKYFKNFKKSTIDGLLSLTGFSLVGGPAYNDSQAAVSVLKGTKFTLCCGSSFGVSNFTAMVWFKWWPWPNRNNNACCSS